MPAARARRVCQHTEAPLKYVILAARILLGAGFLFFGLNILLHFMPMKPESGDAGTFGLILAQHHWMNLVGVLQIIAGVLLLVNRFVPLALTLLAPLLVNILLFHLLLLGGKGIAAGLLCALLELFLLFVYRRNFYPLFAMNPEAELTH